MKWSEKWWSIVRKNARNKEEGGPSVLKIMSREFQMEKDRVHSSLHL